MEFTGASLLIEKLIENNVKTVFGYPGGAVLPIYDELYKKQDKIYHVLTAHEQGASFAADGYARSNDEVGVIIATSGPGATNIITGLANAYLDSIPVVAITGNVASSLSGKDSFQEVDIVSITTPIVKHGYVVRDVNKLASVIDEAFKIAKSGRFGAVIIDIPKDVQVQKVLYEKDKAKENTFIMEQIENKKSYVDYTNLESVLEAINNAKRPCIYAGGGVTSAKAKGELLEFAKKIDAPVALSLMGLCNLPRDNKYNLGMCGMHGTFVSTTAKDKADVLIALGVRFSDRATGDVNIYTSGKTIIHIDIDSSEIEKNVSSKINIEGDVKKVLLTLIEKVKPKENKEWWEYIESIRDTKPYLPEDTLNPKTILKYISSQNTKATNVVTDVGQHQMFTTLYYDFKEGDKFISSGGLGSMGYGLGAALGSAFTKRDCETVLITGDGSFGMNLNEMSTVVTENVPLTIIIMNNRSLGMVRQWQNMFFGGRLSHTDFANKKTDFVKLANAFGCKGTKTTTLKEFQIAYANRPKGEPYLIECVIDEEEKVFPMVPPGGSAKEILLK